MLHHSPHGFSLSQWMRESAKDSIQVPFDAQLEQQEDVTRLACKDTEEHRCDNKDEDDIFTFISLLHRASCFLLGTDEA